MPVEQTGLPAADLLPAADSDRLFSSRYACTTCGISYEPPSPQLFSFNSPQGMCHDCQGLGQRHDFDLELVIPDATKSFAKGAIELVGSWSDFGRWRKKLFQAAAKVINRLQETMVGRLNRAGAFIKRMDVAGRLLAPRLDPNPDTRTLRALWPVLNDPYAFLDRALNRALGIGLGAQAGVDLRDDLLRIFTELRGKSQGQRPMPGEWLDTASFARKSELSTHYEVGSRITLPRYRDEQYMPRPQIVDPLHRDWLAPLRDVRMPRDKIDVFWLQGRSGAGKSALLLQLLERLAGDGLRILWLGDNDAALESVLHLYHRDCLSARDALPDVIAIDDLHAPGKRAGNHVPELARWIDQQGPQQWPVLLTCGPDDLASDFDRDCAGEGFILHATTVPLVDAAEAGRLRTWYEDRFATPAPTTDTAFDQADAQGEGLLVSMAVELREGNLQSFARRFSDRIRRGGLEVALRLPLALNRLYLSAPQDWLDREARERLDALNRNEDFRLASDEAADIRTLRLTHPHLAEAVYRALRDPAVGRAYSHDLDEAFQRAMREQRPDLAFGLVRQCAWPEGAMAQRVADLDLESLAGWPAACVAWLEAHDSHPLWGRFWKDIYTHADTMRLPLPDPQGKASLLALASAWLQIPGHLLRRDGPYVLRIALASFATGHVPAGLHDACLTWLRNAECQCGTNWAFVYQALLDHAPTDAELLDLGKGWLKHDGNYTRDEWSFVYQALLDHAPTDAELLHLGGQWLRHDGNHTRDDWSFVYRALLDRIHEDAELLGLGRQWLKHGDNYTNDGWSFVYRALLDRVPEDAWLLDLGRHWLERNDNHTRNDWGFVYQILLKSAPEDAGLLDLGRHWLGRHDNFAHAGWSHVWETLHKRMPGAADLLDLGRQWVTREGSDLREDWNYVWRTLLATASDDPDLHDLGRQWLKREGNNARNDWAFVYQALLTRAPDDAELLDIGRQWLKHDGHDARDDWSFVYRSLLDRSPGDAELLDVGRRWLKRDGNDARDAWNFVYQALLNRTPDDAELLDLGRQWLKREGNGARDDWAFVYETLLGLAPGDEALLDLGFAWLAAEYREYHASWEIVWKIWMQVSLSSRQYVLLRTKALTMGSQGQGRIVVGGEYVGQVNAHAPFGLFVMLGARSGLLHRNEFPVGHNLGKDHPVGSTLRVQVIRNSFDPTSGKARLNFSYVMP